MAKGPAVLALMTRAPMFAAAIRYEDNPAIPGSGKGIVIEFSPRIATPESGSTKEKAAWMTQAAADFIGDQVTRHTVDWHMLQRVFLDHLDQGVVTR